MSTPGDRLRQARIAAGHQSASDVARALGVALATYTQHENGNRGYSAKKAQRYATFFGTNPEWLLYGRRPTTPTARGMVRVVGRVGDAQNGQVTWFPSAFPSPLVPATPGGTEVGAALEVSGEAFRGFAEDGALIYFEDQKAPPKPEMLGHTVIAETAEGQVYLARLLRGSRRDLYDLERLQGSPLRDQRLTWASMITAIVSAHVADRIIRRESA